MDEIEALHVRAIAEGKDSYADPKTGYDVFTSAYLLRRGVCCGSGCRHCPFGCENVVPVAGEAGAFDAFRDERRERRPS